jgi:hypothetical protein
MSLLLGNRFRMIARCMSPLERIALFVGLASTSSWDWRTMGLGAHSSSLAVASSLSCSLVFRVALSKFVWYSYIAAKSYSSCMADSILSWQWFLALTSVGEVQYT